MENNDRKGSTAVAFLLGAMVGGITALLFAPQTGAQMRGRLKRGARPAPHGRDVTPGRSQGMAKLPAAPG